MRHAHARRPTWVLALLLTAGCGGDEGEAPARSVSPNAQPEIVSMLRADLAAERHAADGGGRAWIERDPGARGPAVAGGSGRWTLVYEAGPLGIAEGGTVFFQVSPFWDWSTPQLDSPDAPGFTEVSTQAEGLELSPTTPGQQLLAIGITGRGMKEGERVRIVYGAGRLRARVDRYAERESPFWIAVDGDGDGVRGLLASSLTVEVGPGPPSRLVLTLPSTACPGEEVRLTVAVLDRVGNAGLAFEGAIALAGPKDLSVPSVARLAPRHRGRLSVRVVASGEGVFRVEGEGANGLRAVSNPLVVSADAPRVLWADLHGHSNLSDGTGTPEDYYEYARDVAGLDVAALTDHDHWGMRPLSHSPELWARIREQAEAFHTPGRFVTLLGYEWTSWIHGHRHVLYFGDEGEVLSSVDPAYESPQQLWDALRGRHALTFAHHSAGSPVATNWDYAPDPDLEPVTEVVSVHGSSEALDSPGLIYGPVRGNFVRDVLDRGYRLGFVGSGDGHDGHPGLSHLASPSGGLAAILSEDLTREAVLAALQARRVYATSGPRILLQTKLGGQPMGSSIEAATLTSGRQTEPPADELRVRVVAPGPLERVDLIRDGQVTEQILCEGQRDVRFVRTIPELVAGDYLYVRAVQTDGGTAWSSPFFIE